MDRAKMNLKRYNPVLKATSFILLIVLSVVGAVGVAKCCNGINVNLDAIGENDFTKTPAYSYYMNDTERYIENLIDVSDKEKSTLIKQKIDELFEGVEDEIVSKFKNKKIEVPCDCEEIYDEDTGKIIPRHDTHYKTADYDYDGNLDEAAREYFNKEYSDEIHAIKNDFEYSPEYFKNHLDEQKNLKYYIVINGAVVTNTPYGFEKFEEENEYFRKQIRNTNTKYIFALDDDFIKEQNSLLSEANKKLDEYIVYGVIWLVLYLIVLAYTIYCAGRKSTVQGITLLSIDKLFTEITIGLVILVLYFGIFASKMFYFNDMRFKMVFYIIELTAGFIIGYALVLSLVRNFKNHTLFKNSLVYKFFAMIGQGIKALMFLYSSSNPLLKTVLMITALGILTMIPLMGFLTIPYAIILAHRHASDFKKLKDGIKIVESGVYNKSIDFDGDEKNMNPIYRFVTKKMGIKSEFISLGDDINRISAGLEGEVERRLKSERLKTELIANISHDIRTPLTSLITYADLLISEETDNENIKKYARVISAKSERLKTLTDDLFESSKASSGNVPVSLERVEINSLLIQALAEFDEKIKESKLDFKLNIPEDDEYRDPIMVMADGRLLWRVIENIISNVLLYSLENSRVYIDITENNGDVNFGSDKTIAVEIKNISRLQLNIPENEITERFKRGDLSRNSEGSGLGLDIATSLMKCQNGELKIKIDGDLFKTLIIIPSANDQIPLANGQEIKEQ